MRSPPATGNRWLPSRAHPSDRGFSLAETILALVLMATAAYLLAESTGAGWRGIRQADDHLKGDDLARALLASVGYDRPLLAGRDSGRHPDGAIWTITIEPYVPPAPLPSRLRIAAYRVDVEVQHPSFLGLAANRTRLSTLKLGRKP